MSSAVPRPGHPAIPTDYLNTPPLLQLSNIRTAPPAPLKRRRSTSPPTTPNSCHHPALWHQSITVPADNMPPLRSISRHSSHSSSSPSSSPPIHPHHHVVDCSEKNICRLTNRPMKQKCTDHCVVVQCPDAGSFPEICTQEDCHVEPCDGGDNCAGGFEDFLQCCTDMHPSGFPDPNSLPQSDWNLPSGDFWDIANQQQQQLQSSSLLPQVEYPPSNAFNSPLFPSAPQQNSVSLPIFPQPSNSSTNFISTSQNQQQQSNNQSFSSNEPDHAGEYRCRWDNCHAAFSSLNELVGHVNVSHLCGPTLPEPNTQRTDDTTLTLPQQTKSAVQPLACHWEDCRTYPNSSLPGPSSGLPPEAAMDQLTSHLFLDHLGISWPHFQLMLQNSSAARDSAAQSVVADFLARQGQQHQQLQQRPPQPSSTATTGGTGTGNVVSQLPSPRIQSYSTPAPSPPPQLTTGTSSEAGHDCATTAHICCWESCNASFDTCAALTDHLTAVHVGGGRSRYDCHWGDCARSGDAGFASKQKIMRHLQAHTGHRPFMCKECGLYFSEAATLQQHMRRHTQEKPFVCDFPGCGKAFAITGALTIHKRTHNGERPFKCPHCTRAFAESSNLSKHLRTHTGDKPYHCLEPGCGKSFARPDQLQRHANVHNKKRSGNAGAGAGTASGSASGSAEPAESS